MYFSGLKPSLKTAFLITLTLTCYSCKKGFSSVNDPKIITAIADHLGTTKYHLFE